ncbi:MAG: hypothetical protein SNJ79_08900, partial [Sphingomonadaceae bacterium]
SVPLHLLTVEAIWVYLAALQPDGVLLLHVSNRFLDLERVVAAAVAAEGLAARRLRYAPGREEAEAGLAFSSSDWIAVTRTEDRMAAFVQAADGSEEAVAVWEELAPVDATKPWRDDFASLLPVLKPLRSLL